MDLSQKLRVAGVFAALSFGLSLYDGARADDDSCLKAPLVALDWNELVVPAEGSLALGEWILPPSSDLPELKTDVRMRAWIERREGRAHELMLELTYADTNELGIPFGLMKVEFSVLTRQGRVATSLDWTDRCNVGNLPSLLPGDSTTVSIEVPGPAGKEMLFVPQFRFWGSLN